MGNFDYSGFLKKYWPIFLVTALAAFLRFWGSGWGLPFQYQTEEYRVIKYALRMGGGDLNPHIFEYPSLYLYFMLFLYGVYYAFGRIFGIFASVADFAIAYVSDPTAFHLIGRWSEALFGVGCVLVTYQIARKLRDEKTGLIAAFGLAILPGAVYTAHATKGDMASIFLGLVFWNFCLNILRSDEPKNYYFAGITYGLMISTKYYPAFLGIVLPMAHLFGPNPKNAKHLIGSLLVIPVFFILGTPYSVLSPEFISEFKSAVLSFGSGKADYWETQKADAVFDRFGRVTVNFLRMFDWPTASWIGNFGLGLVNVLGLGVMLRKSWKPGLMMLVPFALYWCVVGLFKNPAAGYLQPIFPLFIICGAFGVSVFLEEMVKTLRTPGEALKKVALSAVLAFFTLSILLLFRWSALMSYSYTLPDSRTVAKEWIDANLPADSKVLVDLLPFSPPLEMSRSQLEKFHEVAVRDNHYKKEYFRLKLAAYPKDQKGFQIYIAKRSPLELGVLQKHLDEAQKTQDLVEVTGDERTWEEIEKKGIEYLIINSWSEANGLNNYPALAQFYREIPQHAEQIYELKPPTVHHPGPEVRVYALKRSAAKP